MQIYDYDCDSDKIMSNTVLEAELQIRGGIHIIFFLFRHENICCGYSLEAPRRGASNEYPQHMFSWRNKKDISIFRMKKNALSVAMLSFKLLVYC